MQRSLVLAAALILSSCATEVVKLPLPPPLSLPKIQEQALRCLDDTTYEALVVRDEMLVQRVRTLEGIILTTH